MIRLEGRRLAEYHHCGWNGPTGRRRSPPRCHLPGNRMTDGCGAEGRGLGESSRSPSANRSRGEIRQWQKPCSFQPAPQPCARGPRASIRAAAPGENEERSGRLGALSVPRCRAAGDAIRQCGPEGAADFSDRCPAPLPAARRNQSCRFLQRPARRGSHYRQRSFPRCTGRQRSCIATWEQSPPQCAASRPLALPYAG